MTCDMTFYDVFRAMFANGAKKRAIYFVSVDFHLKVRLSQGAELCKSRG